MPQSTHIGARGGVILALRFTIILDKKYKAYTLLTKLIKAVEKRAGKVYTDRVNTNAFPCGLI